MDLVRFQQLAFLMFLKFVSAVVTLGVVDIYYLKSCHIKCTINLTWKSGKNHSGNKMKMNT